MLVGMGTANYALPIAEASSREVDLIPTWRYAHAYAEAVSVMSKACLGDARPDIRKLITHRVSGLENVEKAFEIAAKPRDADNRMVVKVVFNQ